MFLIQKDLSTAREYTNTSNVSVMMWTFIRLTEWTETSLEFVFCIEVFLNNKPFFVISTVSAQRFQMGHGCSRITIKIKFLLPPILKHFPWEIQPPSTYCRQQPGRCGHYLRNGQDKTPYESLTAEVTAEEHHSSRAKNKHEARDNRSHQTTTCQVARDT